MKCTEFGTNCVFFSPEIDINWNLKWRNSSIFKNHINLLCRIFIANAEMVILHPYEKYA